MNTEAITTQNAAVMKQLFHLAWEEGTSRLMLYDLFAEAFPLMPADCTTLLHRCVVLYHNEDSGNPTDSGALQKAESKTFWLPDTSVADKVVFSLLTAHIPRRYVVFTLWWERNKNKQQTQNDISAAATHTSWSIYKWKWHIGLRTPLCTATESLYYDHYKASNTPW